MAKKKDCGGKSTHNLELYQRLNFLHQASTLLTLAGPHFAPLSRSLGRDMDSVRKRSTLRADPSVKRQYCRACHTHLIEGFTLRTRLTRKGGKAIIRTCMYCEKERRLLCNPQHEVFNWKALASDTFAQDKSGAKPNKAVEKEVREEEAVRD